MEVSMPQLLVRDVPQDVVEALKQRAAEHGRSAEAEHRIILEEALRPGRVGFWERAAKLREETRGRVLNDSTDLIRQDRDERGPSSSMPRSPSNGCSISRDTKRRSHSVMTNSLRPRFGPPKRLTRSGG